MKNLFKTLTLVALVAISGVASAQRGWKNAPKDNTGRNLTFQDLTKTLAATDSINPNASHTYIYSEIAGAKTLILKQSNAKKWDVVTLEFKADGTNRKVTFSGQAADVYNDTLTTFANKKAMAEFIFDGTKWIHYNRYQQK